MMERYVLVKLKQACPSAFAAGRYLGHHAQFGNLHALPLRPALRLVEAGEAKLLDQFRLDVLRAEVAALAA